MLVCRQIKPNLVLRQARSFSTWGVRNIEWIRSEMSRHAEDHEGDYEFEFPFLAKKARGEKRKMLIAPCIESSTAYIIQEAMAQNMEVTGIVKPETNLESLLYIIGVNQIAKIEEDVVDGVKCKVVKMDNLFLQQREIESLTMGPEFKFDVVYDEMPVEDLYTKSMVPVWTTIFGHALNLGGTLFVQTANAANHKEKKALQAKMRGLYPEDTFELVDSRRLAFSRQWLYLKTAESFDDLTA